MISEPSAPKNREVCGCLPPVVDNILSPPASDAAALPSFSSISCREARHPDQATKRPSDKRPSDQSAGEGRENQEVAAGLSITFNSASKPEEVW